MTLYLHRSTSQLVIRGQRDANGRAKQRPETGPASGHRITPTTRGRLGQSGTGVQRLRSCWVGSVWTGSAVSPGEAGGDGGSLLETALGDEGAYLVESGAGQTEGGKHHCAGVAGVQGPSAAPLRRRIPGRQPPLRAGTSDRQQVV